MTNEQPTPGRGMPLIGPLQNLLMMVYALSMAPGVMRSAGAVAFPKVIFETASPGPVTPDGQSLAYLELARKLWLRRWASADPDITNRRDAATRVIHDMVQRAHVLERELLEMSGTDL
jgi:hypothetical protein